MSDIPITEITDGTLEGDGYFDKLMKAVDAHLQAEFTSQRIKGTDYATVYLGAMQTVLAQAIQFSLGKQTADKQAELLVAQALKSGAENTLLLQKTATEEAQTLDTTTVGTTPGAVAGMVGKQKFLIQKQTDGFQRDAEQKTLKIMMDNYAIRRSTDSVEQTPTQAANTAIDNFILKAAAGIDVTLPDTYTVSGTITGLAIAEGLIIQNNGGDDISIAAGETAFTFNTALINLAAYNVTTFSNDTGQTIVITNESGNISGADITNVLITVS